MKILKIEFQNINSLRGEHCIDFTKEPFKTNTLFAITGPTGSGKSTILDVISLALFNQVPRLGKITRNEILSKGAILTRNQKEAYAKVTYQCKTGKFASLWTIAKKRTGNLGDYEMNLFNLETETALDLKKSDVPAKNEELIGLNYNQFIKSVLLAQGDFAQFLKAKKEERGELLEKITGTGIYRQLGRLAFEKFRSVNLDIIKQQQTIEIIKSELLPENEIVSLNKQLSEKDEISKVLKSEEDELNKKIEIKKLIKDQHQEIEVLNTNRANSNNKLEQFQKEYGKKLEQHEQLQPHSDDLTSWKQTTKDLFELEEALSINEKRIAENTEKLNFQKKKVNAFTGTEISADNLTKELSAFTNKVGNLQDKKKEKLSEYGAIKAQIVSELRDINFKLNERDLAVSEEQLQELKNTFESKIDECKKHLAKVDLDNTDEEKASLKVEISKIRDAATISESVFQLKSSIENLNTEKSEFSEELIKLPASIENLGLKVDSLRKTEDILKLKQQNELLIATLEEHRQHLEEDHPCPLCGSLEHPFAIDLPEKDNSLLEEIKNTAEQLSKLNHELAASKTSLDHFQKRAKTLDSQRDILNEDLQKLSAQFVEQFERFNINLTKADWNKIIEKIEFQLDTLEAYEKNNRQLKSISSGLPLLRNLNIIFEEGVFLKAELEKLYKGEDVFKESRILENLWTQLTQEHINLVEQGQEILKKKDLKITKLKDLELKLDKDLKKLGFESVSQAVGSLIPHLEFEKLRTSRENLKKEIDTFTNKIHLLDSQLKKYQELDVEKLSEELLEDLKVKQNLRSSIQTECEECRRLLSNEKENQLKLKSLKAEIAEKEKKNKRWRHLNDLIGDSQGKRFNDFAQDLSLTQLLQLANVRLKDLSDRYLIDKPTSEEDDSLVAIDEHMGGQRRSVKTLSGGETFILSLSMALALSDLASKNVEINSLFIDEGFGTLDPETLDQTLDTLEKLQAESSKTIGIISHVDSLKERIATQIKLTRNGQGYSSLKVESL